MIQVNRVTFDERLQSLIADALDDILEAEDDEIHPEDYGFDSAPQMIQHVTLLQEELRR